MIQYYLIHNLDPERKNTMLQEFKQWGLNLEQIKWMEHPNKDEITDDLLESLIVQTDSYSSGVFIPPSRTRNSKGLVCCTYKHYLCLKDIVENDYDYGIIMEDNNCFKVNIPELVNTCIQQLDEVYGEWDVVFDGAWGPYIEGDTYPELLVYPKTNEITNQCHGGTKAANFYLIKKECAKKLMEHYIPFNNSPDWWMNDLFRKLEIKSFWIEPPCCYIQPGHISTCA